MKSPVRLFGLMLLLASTAQAATVDLSLSPQTSNVTVGDTFNVDVLGTLSGSSFGFDGGGFDLAFDTSVLDATSVTLHSPWGPLSTTLPTIDNTSGVIHSSGVGNLAGVADGSYTIATIAFLAQASGSSVLNLIGDALNPWSYDFGTPVETVNLTDGSVNVSAVPIPMAGVLFLSGIGFFAVISRRRVTDA